MLNALKIPEMSQIYLRQTTTDEVSTSGELNKEKIPCGR